MIVQKVVRRASIFPTYGRLNTQINSLLSYGISYRVQSRGMEHLAAIKQVRKVTNGGVAECKEALSRFNWDLDAAIAYIRQKQQDGHYEIDAKKPIYEAGKIAVPTSLLNHKDSVIIEINCNCDFITSSKEFITLAQNTRRALQRAVDLKQIPNADDSAETSISTLNVDMCNEAIFDEQEALTVGRMLRRISGEYKRTIALSNVFLYRKTSNMDYPGIYVHKKVQTPNNIVGTRLGLVNLKCGTPENITKEIIDKHLADIAKALAVQMVANPPKYEHNSTTPVQKGEKQIMKELLGQIWLQVDPVISTLHNICDLIGKTKPRENHEITIGQTLELLGNLLGIDNPLVQDALYVNSGGEIIKLGAP